MARKISIGVFYAFPSFQQVDRKYNIMETNSIGRCMKRGKFTSGYLHARVGMTVPGPVSGGLGDQITIHHTAPCWLWVVWGCLTRDGVGRAGGVKQSPERMPTNRHLSSLSGIRNNPQLATDTYFPTIQMSIPLNPNNEPDS